MRGQKRLLMRLSGRGVESDRPSVCIGAVQHRYLVKSSAEIWAVGAGLRSARAKPPQRLRATLEALTPAFILLLLAPTGDSCRLGAQALERRDLPAAERYLKQCVPLPAAPLDSYLQLSSVY